MDTIKSAVQEVVNEIYHEKGEVRPSELIERAKPEGSKIHNAFEWDNYKAGHEYRLIQARTWLRKVEVYIDDKAERLIHVPLVKLDRLEELESGESYYKPISVVCSDSKEYERAESAVRARLEAAKYALDELKQVATKHKHKPIPNFKMVDRGLGLIDKGMNWSNA